MPKPDIIFHKPFGDVDNGPSAGVNYVVRVPTDENPDEAAKALWDYLRDNYEDNWQEYRRSTISHQADSVGGPSYFKLVQVIVLTTWGDGHRSTW